MRRRTKEDPERERRFLETLQEKYSHSELELFMRDEKVQTLKIDGEQIDLCWMPRVSLIADKTAVRILLEDCKTSFEVKLSTDDAN